MVKALYARSREHLTAARDSRSRLLATWGSFLDAEMIDCRVFTDAGGRGRITVYAGWTPGDRRRLTEVQRCVFELWACLDSLVSESVTAFEALRKTRTTHTSAPFFPVATNLEHLTALLDDSCLDGVLRTQADVVLGCQPFGPEPADPRAAELRRGLEQLFDWTLARSRCPNRCVGNAVRSTGPPNGSSRAGRVRGVAAGQLADEHDVASSASSTTATARLSRHKLAA